MLDSSDSVASSASAPLMLLKLIKRGLEHTRTSKIFSRLTIRRAVIPCGCWLLEYHPRFDDGLHLLTYS